MSFNGVMPQFAALTPEGGVVLVPSNYLTQGLSYVQVPHALQHQPIPHQLSPAPPRPIEAPPPLTVPSPILPPQPRTQSTAKTQAPPLTIEQTNARVRSIKEKCISHYIEGQLIIETSKPITERKLKKPTKQSQPKQCQPSKKQSPTQQQHQQRLLPSELKKLRTDMESWSVSDVVKFIESHEEIRHCAAKFAEDEIDGMALLYMIDRNLNFQTSSVITSMFKLGPAMKIEATLSKYKSNE